MALAAGARIGSYEILASLGTGGMSEVYRAEDSTGLGILSESAWVALQMDSSLK
jgi:hypothetical protein